MLYLIFITFATVAGGAALLTLVSDAFAYEMSRVLEAVLDSAEYRRALRAERRGATRRRSRDAALGFEVPYSARAEVSL